MSVLSANRHQESHLEKWSSFDAMSRSHRADKIKLLRKQLEILKLELDCEKKLTNFYREELKDTERELARVQQELVILLKSSLPPH